MSSWSRAAVPGGHTIAGGHMIELRMHDDVSSMELIVGVGETAPGWVVVSTTDGRVFSRHATEAQAQYAARHMCSRSSRTTL